MNELSSNYHIKSGSQTEIERRFLLPGQPEGLDALPRHHITQGYFESHTGVSARVRLVDQKTAELTKKIRQDGERIEVNQEISVAAAELLLDPGITSIIEKTRYYRDGWEIDVFHGALEGLVLAERELATIDEPLSIPSWLPGAVEVTNKLSNRMLARIARDLNDQKLQRPILDMVKRRIPRIVLTGGPCSGKTTIMKELRDMFGKELHYVPEVASMVIAQVGVTPPSDSHAYGEFQRTIYRIQRGLETITDYQAHFDGKKAVLLDRGTVDAAAYMEQGVPDLDKICRTSVAHDEYSRYDLVLHLSSPSQEIYERNRANNPARYETYDEAVATGKRLFSVWHEHPQFESIPDFPTFAEKIQAVERAIKDFLKKYH